MDINNKRVLVLAPHTDDGEFGCGGTIHKLIQKKCQIKYIAFSDCQESVPHPFPKNILRDELFSATKVLGIEPDDIDIKDYKVRIFNQRRQDILEELIDLKKSYRPEIIFTPCTADVHQDHQVITNECIRAFKTCTILGYELPWNLLSLPSQLLIVLDEENIDAKIKAIHEYKSQNSRKYSNKNYLKALAMTRGTRVNKNFAEAFEIIRMVIT